MELVTGDAGLNLETRRTLVTAITGGWKDEDRREILQWLDNLNEPALAELGRNRLNRERDPAHSHPLPPDEMVRNLGAERLDDGDSPQFRQSRFWSGTDLALARETFRALTEPERDRAARILVEDGRFSVGPAMRGEALSHLLREGASEVLEERVLIRHVSETASKWGWSDPAAAARWVESLPQGQARVWAGVNLALAWSNQSEPETNAWMNSLGAEERRQIGEVLKDRL